MKKNKALCASLYHFSFILYPLAKLRFAPHRLLLKNIRKWERREMSLSEPLSSLMFGFKKASFLKPSSTLTSSFRGYRPSLPWKM